MFIYTYIYIYIHANHVNLCRRPWWDWRVQDPAFDDPEMVNKWIDDCQAKDADRPHPWSQPATKAGDNQLQLQPAKRKRDWTNRRRGGQKYQSQKKSRQGPGPADHGIAEQVPGTQPARPSATATSTTWSCIAL